MLEHSLRFRQVRLDRTDGVVMWASWEQVVKSSRCRYLKPPRLILSKVLHLHVDPQISECRTVATTNQSKRE